MSREGLIGILLEDRLRIPGINMGRTAFGKNMNDRFRLRFEMRLFRSERGERGGCGRCALRLEWIDAEQRCQPQGTKTHACPNDELAAGEDNVFRSSSVFADVLV